MHWSIILSLWGAKQIKLKVWEALLDYGMMAWQVTREKLKSKKCTEVMQANLLRSFDAMWMRKNISVKRNGFSVRWKLLSTSFLRLLMANFLSVFVLSFSFLQGIAHFSREVLLQ